MTWFVSVADCLSQVSTDKVTQHQQTKGQRVQSLSVLFVMPFSLRLQITSSSVYILVLQASRGT